MHPLLLDLLQREQRQGFPDLAGTEVAATGPVTDRLINDVIARVLPPGGRLRDVSVRAHDGNRLTVTVRLSSPAFLPPIPVTLAIDEQPELPHRPILGLVVSPSSGLVAMAISAVQSFVTLPPG